MPAVFDKLGIHFLYPENWTLDEQEADGEGAVTVYSPETALWMVRVFPITVDPHELTLATLQALKAEYTDFEAEPENERIGQTETSGYDMNFICLDLTNTARVRGFRTRQSTCVILYQAEDREYKTVEPVLRAMTISLLRAEQEAAEKDS